MTQWGFDYAWENLAPASLIAMLRSNQAEFVCRYLSDPGGKGIARAEADALCAAGIIIVPNWEVTGTDFTGGYNAGLADGKAAAAALRSLGAPAGTYVWFSIDAGTSDITDTNNYLRGAKAGTAEYIAQLYGDFTVVEAAARAGLGSAHWQTYAWSGGKISGHAALYQYQNNITVSGVSVDRDKTLKDITGPWAHFPATPTPAPAQEAHMTPSVKLWGPDGRIYAAVIGTHDHVWFTDDLKDETTTKWVQVGTWQFTSGVTMDISDPGRVVVGARGRNGELCYNTRPPGSHVWDGWKNGGGRLA